MTEKHSFPVDGRNSDEVRGMKKYGYVEFKEFKEGADEKEGYFCMTCRAFEPRSFTMPENSSEDDGWCKKFKFRNRKFGCCNGWVHRSHSIRIDKSSSEEY